MPLIPARDLGRGMAYAPSGRTPTTVLHGPAIALAVTMTSSQLHLSPPSNVLVGTDRKLRADSPGCPPKLSGVDLHFLCFSMTYGIMTTSATRYPMTHMFFMA